MRLVLCFASLLHFALATPAVAHCAERIAFELQYGAWEDVPLGEVIKLPTILCTQVIGRRVALFLEPRAARHTIKGIARAAETIEGVALEVPVWQHIPCYKIQRDDGTIVQVDEWNRTGALRLAPGD